MPLEISVESKRRPAEAEAPAPAPASEDPRREKCPRCESRNTKFCYYNNYNTSQPRHFCRSCRRYWTLGGSLRNVPIGGSSRNGFCGGPNKRFRTAAYPDHATPSPARHVSPLLFPPSLTGGVASAGFHLGEAFRFELGLGMGMGMGPVGMMWHPEDAWRMETGGGDCFAVPAVPVSVSSPAGEVTGGPDGGR